VANPASTSVLTISSAGTEAATRDPSVDSLTITEADVKHGERTVVVPVSAAGLTGNLAFDDNTTSGGRLLGDAGSGSVIFPIQIPVGSRLKSATARVYGSASHTLTGELNSISDSTRTAIGSEDTSTASASWQDLEVTGLTTTIAAGTSYTFTVRIPGGATSCEVQHLTVVYDRV
jgi:hypothetical protein